MRIGILGLGSMGRRHYENAKKLGHDVDFYDPEVSHSLGREDLIRWADAVVIASPTPYHASDMGDAIFDGNHVLIEKPVASDEHGYRAVAASLMLARERQWTAMTACNLRFHECVKQAKTWIDSGCLGRNLWANFTCSQRNDKPQYLRDGCLLNWGAHEVDLALYLLGAAKVMGASVNQDDSMADIMLSHDTGFRSTIHLDYHTSPEIRTCTIVGDQRHAHLDLVNRKAYLINGKKTEESVYNYKTWDDDYLAEMKAFVERVEGKSTLGATGEEGLATLEVLLEAKRLSHATAAMHAMPAQSRGKKIKITQST